MTEDVILSTLTVVLNSALLSGFIIPQVQSLKEIKDQLFKFQIPFVKPNANYEERKQAEEKQDTRIQDIQQILDMYHTRSAELNALVRWFYVSIGLAFFSFVAVLVWPITKDWFVPAHALAQLILLLISIRSYTVGPAKLSSPLYLVSHLEINPHNLIDAMGISYSIVHDEKAIGKIKPEHPLEVFLRVRLRLHGFRFFFVVGRGNDVYFVSHGPITAETKLWRRILPLIWKIPEINEYPIGKFRLNQIPNHKECEVHLLVFFPFFKHELVSPNHTFMKLQASYLRGSLFVSTGTTPTVRAGETHTGIHFCGQGTKILEVYIDEPNPASDDFVTKAFKRFLPEFISLKEIKVSEFIPDGLKLDNPTETSNP